MAQVSLTFTKWVVRFESASNEAPLRNRLLGPTYEAAKSVVEQHLVDIGEFFITVQRSSRVTKLSFVNIEAGDLWELYPKLAITGETDLTESELEVGFDAVSLDRTPFTSFKDVIRNDLLAGPVNASNITWIIGLTTGDLVETG